MQEARLPSPGQENVERPASGLHDVMVHDLLAGAARVLLLLRARWLIAHCWLYG